MQIITEITTAALAILNFSVIGLLWGNKLQYTNTIS